jgi:hypothetical protein
MQLDRQFVSIKTKKYWEHIFPYNVVECSFTTIRISFLKKHTKRIRDILKYNTEGLTFELLGSSFFLENIYDNQGYSHFNLSLRRNYEDLIKDFKKEFIDSCYFKTQEAKNAYILEMFND